MEEFEALLNESLEMDTPDEGTVVKGKVIPIAARPAIIAPGYHMAVRGDLPELANPRDAPEIAVRDAAAVSIRSAEISLAESALSPQTDRAS